MESYGRNLGIAFQIVDDLLDVLGDEATTGKSLGSDLYQLKPPVPLIHVLEHVSADERDSVRRLRSAERRIETLVGPIWFARLRPQPSAVVCRPGSSGGRIAATQRRLGGPDATARVRRHPGTMTGAWR